MKEKFERLKVDRRAWLALILVIVLDQLSKSLILSSFSVGEVRSIIPGFFNLTLTYNPGAAFGLLSDLPDGSRVLVLSLTICAALAAVGYFLLNEYYDDGIGQIGLLMIVGGAIGNIIDRARFGEVVDFLDVYFRSYHWPAFNIADSAICLGVTVLLFRKPSRKV